MHRVLGVRSVGSLAAALVAVLVATLPASAANAAWAFRLGGDGAVGGVSIVLDGAGNSYLGGYFFGVLDVDPSPAVERLVANGSEDGFVASYSSAGHLRWAFRIGGEGPDLVRSLAVAGPSLWIVGRFSATVDLDPGPGLRRFTSHGNTDGFAIKVTRAKGNHQWSGALGGPGYESVNDVAIAPGGAAVLAGDFSSTADVDPSRAVHQRTSAGLTDGFAVKLSATGSFQWVRRLGGTGADSANRIEAGPSGSAVIAGQFSGTVDFDPGPQAHNRTSHGSRDIYLLSLSSAGWFVRVAALGQAGNDFPEGLAVSSAGQVYLSGIFSGTADFDPGPQTRNRMSNGGTDGFLLKLKADGTFAWVVTLGSTASDGFGAITLDGAGNVYLAGTFQGSMDFNPSNDTFTLMPAGGYDVFNLELTSAHAFVDAWQLGGDGAETQGGIAAAGSRVYTTGLMYDDGDYDPGAGTRTLHHVGIAGVENAFVVRVNH